YGISVEGDDAEDMAGQSEAADLGRTRIEHMEQHAFALFYADRFAVTEHPAIDAEQLISDFEALGFFLRLVVRRLSHLLQSLQRIASQHVHRHVAAATEGGSELLHHQEDFAIIGTGIILRVDVDRSDLAGVSAAVKIAHGRDMRMVKAEARGFWHE